MAKNGLEEKLYDTVKKEIIETYGYSQLSIFSNLEKCGYIKKAYSKKKGEVGVYERLKKSLDLFRPIPEGTDPSLVNLPYDSYVPISVKLFELAVMQGWQNSQTINSIPGISEVHGSPLNAIAS